MLKYCNNPYRSVIKLFDDNLFHICHLKIQMLIPKRNKRKKNYTLNP